MNSLTPFIRHEMDEQPGASSAPENSCSTVPWEISALLADAVWISSSVIRMVRISRAVLTSSL